MKILWLSIADAKKSPESVKRLTEYGADRVEISDTVPRMRVKELLDLGGALALLGETDDEVSELSANVDDMTGEDIACLTEKLREAGAFDVCTIPVGMKKNRPGTLIRVVCDPEKAELIAAVFFRHSTTLGVRETMTRAYRLERSVSERETPLGTVRFKRAAGFGVEREKPEADDLLRIARETGMSLNEIREKLK